MEGSVAAAGQAAQGEAAGQAAEGQQQQAAGVDVGQFAGQLDQLSQSHDQLFQMLQSAPWAQEGEGEGEAIEEPGELDLSFLDGTDPSFDPDQAAQRLAQTFDQRVEQKAQQLIKPLEQKLSSIDEQRADDRRELEADRLVTEFPEFGDENVRSEVVNASFQIADAYGWGEVAKEPSFWRLVYMAGRAAQSANEEGTDGPQAAHLEGGAGARPGGSQQVAGVDQILTPDRKGRGVLPFG